MSPELLTRLRAELSKQTAPAPEEQPAFTSELALKAALRTDFTTEELVGAGTEPSGEVKEELAALLAQCEPVSRRARRSRWAMNDAARRECFESFFAQCEKNPKRFATELKSRLPKLAGGDDPLQCVIDACILGPAMVLQRQTAKELAATQRVVSWLDGLLPGLPSLEEIRAARKYSELMAPFRILARNFRGRKTELGQLREYVEWLPAQGAGDVVVREIRSIARLLPFFDLVTKPPLLLHGLGGVGKSTIVAQFILEHLGANREGMLPFIYIDFDQPAVSLREPLTFLMEGARQLALEFPEWDGRLQEFRSRCQAEMAYNADGLLSGSARSSRRGSRFTSSHSDETADTIGEFAAIWTDMMQGDRPLLLVLDSFEEVQTRSAALLPGLFSLLQQWAARIPRLRVVLAGRADVVQEFKTEPVPVGELDLEAAVGFVQSHGVTDLELARYIAGRFARNPLTLQLAVAVALREGAAAHEILASVQVRNWYGTRVDAFRVQQELVRRNLTHLHDGDVEKLAMPGLVVRRVTPEIILEVLAKPCDLQGLTIEGAREIFRKLTQEVSIVMQADPDGSVRYRTELRRELMPLVKKEEPERSREIHDAAVVYYEKRDDGASRAEEIYHRLSRGDKPNTVDDRIIPGIEEYLEGALGELPAAAHAYLAMRFGWQVPPEVRREADLADWEAAEASDLRAAFGSGALSTLEASARRLEERPDRTARSPLYPLEAILYERLGQYLRAMRSAEVAFALVENSASGHEGWALLMTMGRLAQRMSDWRPARRYLRTAMMVAHRLKEGRLIVCAGVELLRVNGRLSAGKFPHGLFRKATRMPPAEGGTSADINEDIVFSLATSASETVQTRRLEENPDEWRATLLPGDAFQSLVREVIERAGNDDLIGQLSLKVFQQRYRQISRVVGAIDVKAFDVVSYAETTYSIAPLRAALKPAAQGTTSPNTSTGPATFAGVEMREVHLAIVSAFNHEELNQMLTFEFNEGLEMFVTPGPFNSEVFNLLVEFRKQGRERDLLAAVYRERPANPAIQALYGKAQLGPQASVQQAGALVSSAPTRATDSGMEKIIHSRLPFLNVSVWSQKLSEVSAQVCQILEDDQPRGTGFLIGPDRVLTAYHVVQSAIEKGTTLACRFDYKIVEGGVMVPGFVVHLCPQGWLVDSSPYSPDEPQGALEAAVPAEDQLDYALLRLDRELANEPLTPGGNVTSGRRRGFIAIPEKDPKLAPDSPLIILQHPGGGPMKVAVDSQGVIGLNANGTRLRYRTQTEPGSGGSPCFDFEWNLIALHHLRVGDPGGPVVRQGIPIAAIRHRLMAKGLLPSPLLA